MKMLHVCINQLKGPEGRKPRLWPRWLNPITWRPGGEPKVYRWLWFNWWWG
jgi:hypothetical protein